MARPVSITYHSAAPCLLTESQSAEHIDIKEAAQRGLRVGYTPDVLTDAGELGYQVDDSCTKCLSVLVADLSVMLALMAGRNGGIGVDLVQKGQVSCPNC